jgi:hypothetical protein
MGVSVGEGASVGIGVEAGGGGIGVSVGEEGIRVLVSVGCRASVGARVFVGMAIDVALGMEAPVPRCPGVTVSAGCIVGVLINFRLAQPRVAAKIKNAKHARSIVGSLL